MKRLIYCLLLLTFCIAPLLHSQSTVDDKEFELLRKEKVKKDSIILSRLSPGDTETQFLDSRKTNDIFQDQDVSTQKNWPLLILLIVAFVLVIVLMIIQFNLRQKMKKIQVMEDMKSQHKTRTLMKSIEAQKQDLLRLKNIESDFKTIRADREQLQEQVKKSELLQKAIIAIHHPVVLTDLEGTIVFCNLEFAKLHGLKASMMLGKNMSMLYADGTRSVNTINNRESWEDKVQTVITKDRNGMPINLYSKSAIINDSENNPLNILITFDEIPDNKVDDKTEELEKACEEKHRIFETIMDVYYEIDLNGSIREISPSVLQLCGFRREELIGKKLHMLYADDDQRQKFIIALKKSSKLTDYEIDLRTKDQKNIPCKITARLLLDEVKMPSIIAGCIRENIKGNQEKIVANKIMEDLKLINKDLLDFAYITSHDLKSPLRAINTLANWVMMDDENRLSKESKEQMQLLINRTERMHNLIDAIFDYTNIVSFEGEKTMVGMNKMLSDLQKRMNIPQNISIKVQDNMPTLLFEKSRIEQVFENLIENSIKFMDKEKGLIIIEWANRPSEYEFSITDNGPGIEPQYFDKVFQIFQTLKPRDEVEGVGIGLAIIRKIITKYGGRIWMKSGAGVGLIVCFTIPKNEK